MIIEGAFLKIPEVLLKYDNRDDLYEASIINLLTNGIILELNARNIDNPLMKIQLEKRYKMDANIKCDVFVNFSDFQNEPQLCKYGFYNENWIEAKYFGGLARNKGTETKSENAAKIIYDIYRLIKNTHEKDVKRGLYSLNLFNYKPEKYLAFSRKDGSRREWLDCMFTSGINEFCFNLANEPDTIKKNVFHCDSNFIFELKCTCRSLIFKPLSDDNDGYYGYLIQILAYELKENKKVYKQIL